MGKSEKEITDEEALQNFLLDIECLDKLLPWTGKFNIFDVLKVSRAEICHSNMLAWIMNPNENHGFGDVFLKGVLQRIVENDTSGKYDVFKILLLDMYTFSVYREWKNIDILLVSSEEEVVIAIENKVGSHEHSNQLARYRDIIENEYKKYQKIYVFLTPDGEEPSDTENWDVLTYYDILDVLENAGKKIDLQDDVKLMIRNYIDVVRRDIVEDQQLVEICNKIYSKHKRALDLIYEHKTNGKSQLSDITKNVLYDLTQEGKIVVDTDWGAAFHTSTMDEILHPLAEPNSSWGNNYLYEYWFMLEEDRFYLLFELGGWNVPTNEMKNMRTMIDELKPADKKKDVFRYKRIYRSKWYDLSDSEDLETDVRVAVTTAVNDALEMEQNMLNKIKEQRAES